MKLSDTDRILAVLRQQSAGSGVPPTPQNFQRFLCDHGISGGNFYQEVEMDSELVDAHEDISTSRDEVQLHSHTFYEVLYCSSGDLEYLLGTERYRLQKGDIVIIPPGVSHRPLFLEQLTEPYRRMVLWISCSFAERITGFLPELPPCRPHLLLRTDGTQWEMLEQPFRTAAKNLIQSGVSLEQTAAAVGFGDYSNFYRSFRREYGITPVAYRQRVRQREP